jgi:hypothetical protein
MRLRKWTGDRGRAFHGAARDRTGNEDPALHGAARFHRDGTRKAQLEGPVPSNAHFGLRAK